MAATLEFWRLKERPVLKTVCSPRFTPSDYLLKKVFSLPEIREEDREEYIRRFKKNCVELMNQLYDKKYYEEMENVVKRTDEWVQNLFGGLDEEKEALAEATFTRYEDRLQRLFGHQTLSQVLEKMVKRYGRNHFIKVAWKGSDKNFKLFVELFVNLGLKVYETVGMSWSQWLTTSSEGIYLLETLRDGDRFTKRYAGAVLVTYLLTIYVMEGYDEQLFQKEMFSFLPVLSKYLTNNPMLNKGIQYAMGFGSTTLILRMVKREIQDELGIPDEWFENWYKRV
jgi:hypothetical protein